MDTISHWVEQLKSFVRQHELPRTDMALFGVRCPYCGKSDRIKPLEPPQELTGTIDDGTRSDYEDLWRRFALPEQPLGVCKFCENPLRLGGNGTADPLMD